MKNEWMELLFVSRMPPPSGTPFLSMRPQKRSQYDDASFPFVARTVPRSAFRTVKVFNVVGGMAPRSALECDSDEVRATDHVPEKKVVAGAEVDADNGEDEREGEQRVPVAPQRS